MRTKKRIAILISLMLLIQPMQVFAGVFKEQTIDYSDKISYSPPISKSPFTVAAEAAPQTPKPSDKEDQEAKAQADKLKQLQRQIEDDKIIQSTQMMSEIMRLILDEYLESVSPDMLYEYALRGMMDALDDYSVYFSDTEMESFTGSLSGERKGLGILMNESEDDLIEIVKVYKNSPAEKAGLKIGDKITKIESYDVKEMEISDFQRIVAESETNLIHIEIIRGTEVKKFEIEKDFFEIESVTVYKLEDVLEIAKGKNNGDIRLVVVSVEAENTANEMKEAIDLMKSEGVTRIILDLRGNGGGYEQTALDICNMLVPEGVIISTVDKQGTKIIKNSALKTVPFKEIYVLVDEYTASAAEIICSALQDSKAATLYGRTTYGKGVLQGLYSLPTGGGIKLTVEEYLRRNGGKINKIGVTPDVIIESGDILEEAYKKIQK